ncbi:CDP-alcohol phosphatidyltransferase family protein [Pilimelia columellifera]|uniref:CDP-diacylglycerol--glycerol-3-phosphate 3-phosphatidyltransferase n=1 Tax=Pilimelia columellifera subsp. columellifera TaxID=706583 RepID=A0ABN3NAU6_9ACTN
MSYRLGAGVGRLGVRPTTVTLVGLACSVSVPLVVVLGPGWPLVAAALVALAVTADSVDGAVAVVTGRASRLGHVHDALADRIAELCWGVAFWLVGAPGPLAVACVAGAWLYEYACAQAAAAEMSYRGPAPMAESPTRVGLVIVGLTLTGFAGLLDGGVAVGVATLTLVVWALISLIGFGQLLGLLRAGLR